MYEQLKNELLTELYQHSFTGDDIKKIMECLDKTFNSYEVTKKETNIIPFNTDLPPLVKTFLVSKAVEGFASGTLYNYKKILWNFFLRTQKTPDAITANDIRVYLYNYQQERGISYRSLDKVRGCISSFYSWLYAEDYIEKNPMAAVNKIKYEKKPKKPCTQTDLEYLRMACKTAKQRAILEVLYSTGCRVGELVLLKKSDIDWQEKTVHLFGKGKKHRTSFINAKAEVALREYLNSRNDDQEWLFVSDRRPYNQMHVSGIQKIIRELSNRANGNIGKKISPHTLRHTCASVLIENNANIISVQKLLGHENINTTMTYIHTSLEGVKLDHHRAVI